MDSARNYTSVSQDSKSIENSLVIPFSHSLKKANDVKEKSDSKEKDGLSYSQNFKQSFDDIYNSMKTYVTSGAYENRLKQDAADKIREQCIQYLLYMLLGIKPDKDYLMTSDTGAQNSGQIMLANTTTTYSSFYAETEETSFSTEGKVITKDGREITFNLDLIMSRSFASYYEETSSSTAVFTDPLVINLDTNVAEVSDVKISFDLDCDGQAEEISSLSSKSGYLSLDKNGDGIINDGSELFGTKSGDGFSDLSQYDEDGNGWIDEADSIYDKLKICVMNPDGSQTLYTLSDKNIGALYLGSASTDFSLNNLITNETNARIRRTGIFLYENGDVGTMQHLDLAQ